MLSSLIRILVPLLLVGHCEVAAEEKWTAPDDAATVVNPLKPIAKTIDNGSQWFKAACVSCHGNGGKGDAPTAAFMKPKPADLTDPALWAESDGALFWKITNGHNTMPGWKAVLNEQQRWEVVLFLRTLSPRPATVDKAPEKVSDKNGNVDKK